LKRFLYFTPSQFALFLSFIGSFQSYWVATYFSFSRNDKSSIYGGAEYSLFSGDEIESFSKKRKVVPKSVFFNNGVSDNDTS